MLLVSRRMRFAGFQFNVSTRELLRVEAEGVLTPVSLGSRATDLLLLFPRHVRKFFRELELLRFWLGHLKLRIVLCR